MMILDLFLGTVALAALLLPGWLVARTYRVPQPLLAGFIGGNVALVSVVLVLDALRLPLTLASVGVAWALLTLTAVFWFRRKSRPAPADVEGKSAWHENRTLLLPLIPAILVVAYRAGAQPLFGVDTIFRWNYLAEQMLARSSLGFYPPVTGANYEIYSWPDGIAPAVSALYFFAYAFAGAARPVLTAPVVVFQFVLVLMGVHALARKLFSPRAAVFAVALVACSPVILWATAMGQETGLTAIAVAGLLLYLPRERNAETPGAIGFAALAAGLGALAREYGLILPVVGLGLCLIRRLSPRACSVFLAVAAASVAPWYVRNWIHTGNPIFNLAIGSWFPVNAVHAWLNESYQVEFGWSHLPPEAPRLFVVNCLAALLGGLTGAVLFFRRASAVIATAGVMVAIWVASLGYTAAGFIYSLRVLNPALVLAAVLGGAALARLIPAQRSLNAAVLALGLFATDAALRMLTLPGNVYRVPPAQWLSAGRALHDYHQRPVYHELTRVAGTERMLVLGPNALLTRQGARTVPLWSPEVRFVFDDTLTPLEIARRLRAANIGFVLLNTGTVNERFLAHSAFLRDPAGTLQPIWSDGDMVLLKVRPSDAR